MHYSEFTEAVAAEALKHKGVLGYTLAVNGDDGTTTVTNWAQPAPKAEAAKSKTTSTTSGPLPEAPKP